MDTFMSELLTVAAQAAVDEARERSGVIKAQLKAICDAYGVPATIEGMKLLPDSARAVANRLTSEYAAWTEAGHKTHMICADARRDYLH